MVLDMVKRDYQPNPGQKPLNWIVIDAVIIAAIVAWDFLTPDIYPTKLDLWRVCYTFVKVLLFQIGVEFGLKPVVEKYRKRKEAPKSEGSTSTEETDIDPMANKIP